MKKSQTEIIQHDRRIEGLKTLAIVFSIVIYLSFVIYAEFHLYSLITNFVPADFQAIGVVAVAVSALTAVALPLAIHFWFRSGGQQTFAFVFYGMHFVFVVFNLILDSHMVEGSEAPPFVTDIYSVWILPGYLALYGVCWTVIWFMDDSSKEIDKTRELEARQREFLVNRKLLVVEAQQGALEAAFESTEAKQVVNRWAAHNAPKLLAAELGMTPQELGIDERTVFKYWLGQQEEQTARETAVSGNYQNGVTVNRLAADSPVNIHALTPENEPTRSRYTFPVQGDRYGLKKLIYEMLRDGKDEIHVYTHLQDKGYPEFEVGWDIKEARDILARNHELETARQHIEGSGNGLPNA